MADAFRGSHNHSMGITNMDNNVWAERGITWASEDVARQPGNQGDKVAFHVKAVIPVCVDLDLFRQEYGDACVLGIMDGTSVRVMAQDVNRTGIAKGVSEDDRKERIHLRLKGIRNRPVGGTTTIVKEVKVYTLPNGQKYNGTDLAEFQGLFAAALIDAGVGPEVALTLAKQQTL